MSTSCSAARALPALTSWLGALRVASSAELCASWCTELSCGDEACHGCAAGCRIPRRPSEYWTNEERLFTNAFGSRDGTQVQLKGVNWPGMDEAECFFSGADRRPLHWYAAYLKEQGFNAVRVPLAADAITSRRHACQDPIRAADCGCGWVAEWGTTGDLSEALSSDRIAELSICPVDNPQLSETTFLRVYP